MKALPLLPLLFFLVACDGKDPEVMRTSLKAVMNASRDVVVKRAEANSPKATPADGEDYRAAKEALVKAEAAATAAGATELDLAAQRKLGEAYGKKSVEEMAAFQRKLKADFPAAFNE